MHADVVDSSERQAMLAEDERDAYAVPLWRTWIKDMARTKQRIRRPAAVDGLEKRTIVVACETFIRDVLKPRFLPEIRPTEWNYVIDIHGAWMVGRYRFMQRYRSGMEHNRGEEFDVPFARIDRMERDRFDIYWMRHTGK
jgi:hypothetical protein